MLELDPAKFPAVQEYCLLRNNNRFNPLEIRAIRNKPQFLKRIMPLQPPNIYSIGSLTGPVPFKQVIRSLIATLNDEAARCAVFKGTVFLDDRNSPGTISDFIRNITDLAERWTQKRIEYLDAAHGSINHRDGRLFDHDLIQKMRKTKSYGELIGVLDECQNEHGLHYERE